MKFVAARWRDTGHGLLCGGGTIPEREFCLDEPALLRRAKLLNHRVEARLPLLVVVSINSHVTLPYGRNAPLLVARVLSAAAPLRSASATACSARRRGASC